MSRRSVLKKYQIFDDADTTTNPESVETDISSVDFATYHLEAEAGVDALIDVYFCNDKEFTVAASKKLFFQNQPTIEFAVDTDVLIHVENKGFKWVYIKITNAGGTGNINGWVTGNVRGA
jgi:hypothetical protein